MIRAETDTAPPHVWALLVFGVALACALSLGADGGGCCSAQDPGWGQLEQSDAGLLLGEELCEQLGGCQQEAR